MHLAIPYIGITFSLVKVFLKRIYIRCGDMLLWVAALIFGNNIKLPTSWNELSEKQLQEISHALEQHTATIDSVPKADRPLKQARLYVFLVKNLLRENNWGKVWIALRQIPPKEYAEYLHFLKDVTRTKFLPAFKIGKKTYHPPLDRLQNMSIEEFSFVDALYYNWKMTSNPAILDMLCATLYRPAGTDNELDIRKPFNKIFVEQEKENFRKLGIKKKTAIAYAYEGSRNYITKLYPSIFPVSEESDNDKPRPARYTPFEKLLQHKIGYDPSKLEITQKLNLHKFLRTYENELKEEAKQL